MPGLNITQKSLRRNTTLNSRASVGAAFSYTACRLNWRLLSKYATRADSGRGRRKPEYEMKTESRASAMDGREGQRKVGKEKLTWDRGRVAGALGIA